MKRFSLLSLLAIPVLLIGCSNDVTTPVTDSDGGGSEAGITAADRAEIEGDMFAQPDLFADLTFEEPGETELPYFDSAPALSPDTEDPNIPDVERPLRFFRHITEREKTIVIVLEEGDSVQYARVSVRTKFRGTFNIVYRTHNDSADLSNLDIVRKRLTDVGHRRAVWVRRLHDDDGGGVKPDPTVANEDDRPHRRWHLAAVSNREVASPEHTANIVGIQLESRSGEIVKIEDPLELMRFPKQIPHFQPGEAVKVTVWTRNPTDLVYLFARWGRQFMPMVEPGKFEGRFQVPEGRRFFHIGVNAFERGTLVDRDTPYDSDFWGLLLGAGLIPDAIPDAGE